VTGIDIKSVSNVSRGDQVVRGAQENSRCPRHLASRDLSMGQNPPMLRQLEIERISNGELKAENAK